MRSRKPLEQFKDGWGTIAVLVRDPSPPSARGVQLSKAARAPFAVDADDA
jgi:hypothetical protein